MDQWMDGRMLVYAPFYTHIFTYSTASQRNRTFFFFSHAVDRFPRRCWVVDSLILPFIRSISMIEKAACTSGIFPLVSLPRKDGWTD